MTAVDFHRLSNGSGIAHAHGWLMSLLCHVLGVGGAVLTLFADLPGTLFLGGMGVLFVRSFGCLRAFYAQIGFWDGPARRWPAAEIRMGSAGNHHDCCVVQQSLSLVGKIEMDKSIDQLVVEAESPTALSGFSLIAAAVR